MSISFRLLYVRCRRREYKLIALACRISWHTMKMIFVLAWPGTRTAALRCSADNAHALLTFGTGCPAIQSPGLADRGWPGRIRLHHYEPWSLHRVPSGSFKDRSPRAPCQRDMQCSDRISRQFAQQGVAVSRSNRHVGNVGQSSHPFSTTELRIFNAEIISSKVTLVQPALTSFHLAKLKSASPARLDSATDGHSSDLAVTRRELRLQ